MSRKRGPRLAFILATTVGAPLIFLGSILVAIRVPANRPGSPPTAVAPARTAIDPMPATAPKSPVALPLEKRQAIYQLYCIRSDIVFRAEFEALPLGEQMAWKSRTPQLQADAKEIWVGLNNYRICETIAEALSEADYPIYLTVGDISRIAQEGRDQHWPERP